MKNWKHWAFMACDKDDGTTHTHEWEWKVTTPAKPEADGVETKTCTTCGATDGTRIIARIPFTSVDALGTWLTSQQPNTSATTFTIALNVNDISNLFTTLTNNADKYVSLDLSGSTITTIPENTFYGGVTKCLTLTGIIIPNSVINIGDRAFDYCDSFENITIPAKVTSIGQGAFFNDALIRVTFLGIITADNLGSIMPGLNIFQPAFFGDLDTKYLTGGIGTYTRIPPDFVWTKQ